MHIREKGQVPNRTCVSPCRRKTLLQMEHVLKQHVHHALGGHKPARRHRGRRGRRGKNEREDELQVHIKERLTPAACRSVFDAGRCIEAFQTPATRSNSNNRALKLDSSNSRHIHHEPHISIARGLIGPSPIHGSNPHRQQMQLFKRQCFWAGRRPQTPQA